MHLLIDILLDVRESLNHFVVLHDVDFAWVLNHIVLLIFSLLHYASQLLPEFHKGFLYILGNLNTGLACDVILGYIDFTMISLRDRLRGMNFYYLHRSRLCLKASIN